MASSSEPLSSPSGASYFADLYEVHDSNSDDCGWATGYGESTSEDIMAARTIEIWVGFWKVRDSHHKTKSSVPYALLDFTADFVTSLLTLVTSSVPAGIYGATVSAS